MLIMANEAVMHFPELLELLFDPDGWVADTGVGCNSTSHAFVLTNKCIASRKDKVMLPDGSKKQASMITDLKIMVFDCTNDCPFKSSMENIKYCTEINLHEWLPCDEVANMGSDTSPLQMNVNHVHELLGHIDKDRTRCTVKHL
eukprot:3151795-Ditylum_brightwellii.AAC.1